MLTNLMMIQPRDSDVVSADSSLLGTPTFKISQLREKLQSTIKGNFGTPSAALLKEGVSCELLEVTGGGWQKGKLYLRLEFVSDDELTALESAGFHP